MVGQKPGHSLAGGQPRFHEPPGTGRGLDRRPCDGFDGEAASEIRIGDQPAQRCGVIGDGDQPESGSGVGGVDRPDGLVRGYARLGPLAVPVGPRTGGACPRGVKLGIPGLDPCSVVQEAGEACKPIRIDGDEDCGDGHVSQFALPGMFINSGISEPIRTARCRVFTDSTTVHYISRAGL